MGWNSVPPTLGVGSRGSYTYVVGSAGGRAHMQRRWLGARKYGVSSTGGGQASNSCHALRPITKTRTGLRCRLAFPVESTEARGASAGVSTELLADTLATSSGVGSELEERDGTSSVGRISGLPRLALIQALMSTGGVVGRQASSKPGLLESPLGLVGLVGLVGLLGLVGIRTMGVGLMPWDTYTKRTSQPSSTGRPRSPRSVVPRKEEVGKFCAIPFGTSKSWQAPLAHSVVFYCDHGTHRHGSDFTAQTIPASVIHSSHVSLVQWPMPGPCHPPPLKSPKKSQQISGTNRRTDFSAKQVPSALDLSPRPQAHLPFVCSLVGVMWKAKICLNFQKQFSSPGLYMVLKH